jgi:dTDP-4-amino-4,6-dideoxygalactose transaminase
LGGNGEIITTPFSYVATTSTIIWENCNPVFVDIHPEYLTIDETKIEAAITDKTTAILATHVFGNPCNVDKIKEIARKYNLKVIYDAAHAFGVEFNGTSVFNYGDVSTCSFHATKIFHTAEGGAIFCQEKELMRKLFYSHNFGHDGPLSFHGLGINGKISELQAAMGLSVLSHIGEIFEARRQVIQFYESSLDFSKIRKMVIRENTKWNYSYYPIIFETEQQLLNVQSKLNAINIFPRRYFYPSLNTINFVNGPKMEISEEISSRILCLPLSHDIDESVLDKVIYNINTTIS